MWFFGSWLDFDFGSLSRLIADGRGVFGFGLVWVDFGIYRL